MLDRERFVKTGVGGEWEEMWPGKELEIGDSIQGRYVKKVENFGDNKKNIYVLDYEGKKVGVWGSTVIDSRMAEIAIGKVVGIEYVGQKESKNRKGKFYKDFYVAPGIDYPGDER